MRMPALALLGLLFAASSAACGSSSTTKPTTEAAATALGSATAGTHDGTPTANASTSQGTAASGSTVEVTGIVGSVNARTQSIQIERRSGAEVTKISVRPSTVLRNASGGTTSLADIRPSDRIVARGSQRPRR